TIGFADRMLCYGGLLARCRSDLEHPPSPARPSSHRRQPGGIVVAPVARTPAIRTRLARSACPAVALRNGDSGSCHPQLMAYRELSQDVQFRLRRIALADRHSS